MCKFNCWCKKNDCLGIKRSRLFDKFKFFFVDLHSIQIWNIMKRTLFIEKKNIEVVLYWLHLSFWWLLKYPLNSQRCFWTIELCTWVWCPHLVTPCINVPLKEKKKNRGKKSLWKEKKKCDVSPWIIPWNKKELTTSHSYASCKSQGMKNISSYPTECPVTITTASYSSRTAWKGHHWSTFFSELKDIEMTTGSKWDYFTN